MTYCHSSVVKLFLQQESVWKCLEEHKNNLLLWNPRWFTTSDIQDLSCPKKLVVVFGSARDWNIYPAMACESNSYTHCKYTQIFLIYDMHHLYGCQYRDWQPLMRGEDLMGFFSGRNQMHPFKKSVNCLSWLICNHQHEMLSGIRIFLKDYQHIS